MKAVHEILQKDGGWYHGLHLHIENRTTLLQLCIKPLVRSHENTADWASPSTDQIHLVWNCPIRVGTMHVVERLGRATPALLSTFNGPSTSMKLYPILGLQSCSGAYTDSLSSLTKDSRMADSPAQESTPGSHRATAPMPSEHQSLLT
jgi:hypothetical protein